jgi:hypothetical protein
MCVASPQFNLRVSDLCYGVGLLPNSVVFLKEMFEQASRSELVRKDDVKAERSRNMYDSHTISVRSCTVRQRQFQLQLAYEDVTTLARSHRRAVLGLWKTRTLCLLL